MTRDHYIRRCPVCGEWAWRGICYVPHENIHNKEAA